MSKVRSFVYDYRLSDGSNAHREFQILSLIDTEYPSIVIINVLIARVPNVVPLAIHEILVDDITMDKLQSNVENRVHMPYSPLFINKEELHMPYDKKKN